MKRQATSTPLRKGMNKKPKTSSFKQQSIRVGGEAKLSKLGELKFIDVAANGDPPLAATWSAAVLLNGLLQGTTGSTRIGRKVTLKSILLKYNFALAATTTGGGCLRILVVYDKQANVAAPAITDILLTDDARSQNNLSNNDRFVTIFDHLSDIVSVNNNYSTTKNLFKRMNLETHFNTGNAGDITDITGGSVYLFIAQANNFGIAAPDFTSRIRIRFSDL